MRPSTDSSLPESRRRQLLVHKLINLLQEIGRHTAQDDEKITRTHKLTRSQMHALYLLHPGEELSLTDLAARMRVTRATASTVVTKLVDKGLLTRREDPHDRRYQNLSLTAAAQELCARYKEHIWRELPASRYARSLSLSQLNTMVNQFEALYTAIWDDSYPTFLDHHLQQMWCSDDKKCERRDT